MSTRGLSYSYTSPAHFSLMLFRHSKPFWRERFTGLAGIGAAGIVVRSYSDRDSYFSDEPGNEYLAHFIHKNATNFGYSLTGHLGLNFHLNQRDAFSMRLLHYQGISTLFTLTDEQLYYNGDRFRAQSRNKGTYSALQLGYTRALGRSARPDRTRWVPDPKELERTEFYIGVEAGPKIDYFSHTENGPYLEDRPLRSNLWGLLAGVGWKERHQLETGLWRNYASEIVYLELPGNFTIGRGIHFSSYRAWQIPLRYRYRLPLIRHRLYLVPSAGALAMLGIPVYMAGSGTVYNTYPSGTSGDTTFYSTVSYTFETNYVRSHNFALEGGLGLEARLGKRVSVRFSARYQHGFATVSRTDVEYWPVNEGPYQGTIRNKGSMMQYLLGINVPLYRKPVAAAKTPVEDS